jgi:hypothetical protein
LKSSLPFTRLIIWFIFCCCFKVLKMPPKKDAAPEPKPLIGRIGTSLKIGIVGLPNVG